MTETLSMEREYPAPPERVFKAWTDVTILQRWFGCGPGMLWKVHEWDARVGGALHVSLDFDSGPFEVRGEFLVVDPPRRLRYTWSNGETVEVAFEAHGSGTRLRLEHRGLIPGDSMTAGGWTTALEQLGGALTAPKRKSTDRVPPDKLRLYQALLGAAGIDSRSNFGSAYTAVNGNMYSMISKYGVVGIRLPDAERAAFIADFDTAMFRADPAWPPSKELVAVPERLLEDTEALRPYMELSHRHAQSLRPKTTRKPAPQAGPQGSAR